MSKRRTAAPEVHTITSAPTPLGDDITRRARRYMVQMGLRTACFLGAVLTWGRIPTAVSVALLVGAVVLPYVAVVLANAGRERPERAETFTDLDLVQLTAAPHGQAWGDAAWDPGMRSGHGPGHPAPGAAPDARPHRPPSRG